MHERPTDNDRRQTAKEVHGQSKAGDSEGMGCHGQWSGSLLKQTDFLPLNT